MNTRVIKMMAVVLAAGALLFACGKENVETNGDNDGGNAARHTPTSGPWVDLGLPSGLLWYSCNLGASSPEEYGDYYAWGETATKSTYDWTTYRYCNGDYNQLTKYCINSYYGNYGYMDGLTTLEAIDDAATQMLGDGARIPTVDEWVELRNNTTAEWTTVNGVNGRRFTAANGNSIFLPAAGSRRGGGLYYAGSNGWYWSASLYDAPVVGAWNFEFRSDNQGVGCYIRNEGASVRAVRSAATPTPTPCTTTYGDTTASAWGSFHWHGTEYTASGDYTHTLTNAGGCDSIVTLHLTITPLPAGYVDLGLPSGLLWAECNIGASSPEEYGNYYAWGETAPKSFYDWITYLYCNGSHTTITKYCNDRDYGDNGFTDNLTTLLPEDDAATQVLGDGARIPTSAEWAELRNNTTAERTTMNGVNGCKFTAANGNSIFLPAAGYRYGGLLDDLAGREGNYWSSELNDVFPNFAIYFWFNSEGPGGSESQRYYGKSVRAVRAR